MAIRLSGMNSNLDTDSIVKALVSAYSVTKDNLVKSQTKLSWQKDSWKEKKDAIPIENGIFIKKRNCTQRIIITPWSFKSWLSVLNRTLNETYLLKISIEIDKKTLKKTKKIKEEKK